MVLRVNARGWDWGMRQGVIKVHPDVCLQRRASPQGMNAALDALTVHLRQRPRFELEELH